MSVHPRNRDEVILRELREELVGPCTKGTELDCSGELVFEDLIKAAGPWKQKHNGEEILTRDRPTKRYGVGVLYPYGLLSEADEAEESASASESIVGDSAVPTQEGLETIEGIANRNEQVGVATDDDDFDLSGTHSYRPSSTGITFLVDFRADCSLRVEASGGLYTKKGVLIGGRDREWWLRRSWKASVVLKSEEVCTERPKVVVRRLDAGSIHLSLEIFTRPFQSSSVRMITVSLVNRTPVDGSSNDEKCLFQVGFDCYIDDETKKSRILPYPESERRSLDEEEESIDLLYRNTRTYAIGHGCAADWQSDRAVSAVCFPTYEAGPITPDVRRTDGTALDVPMAVLAGLVSEADPFAPLEEVASAYERWIQERKTETTSLDSDLQGAAKRHLADCDDCAARIRNGISFLKRDAKAFEAFKLANYAILLQQVRTRREPRRLVLDDRGRSWSFSEPFPPVTNANADRGRWRAFQIAFLLMSVESACNPRADDRDVVELIWFPTGGGKTEAYLGLAAFFMFHRRLVGNADVGVNVLMRYTLRLLTAQQFQRASALVVAMEYLRRQNPQLGPAEFSIGIWLGSATSPNSRQEAIHVHRSLVRAERNATNKFILSRCPWCAAQMGPVNLPPKAAPAIPRCLGYERAGPTVVFKCPDAACDFQGGLPIYVVDEDIYEKRPTLIIGTVDKFAMLAWEPNARTLFGLERDGERKCSPPGLIIQDELHLISGPLGSMVGLYEGVIEELCTDRRGDDPVLPKLVCSTATIRRYKDQVRCLYGRKRAVLFPPPGLTADDSFFAKREKLAAGTTAGRRYVGIFAPGLGSLQTVQVRTFTALLQAPMLLDKEEQDPWWTLLTFFNSLRELGTTLSLFQSDIPDYQNVLRNRFGLKPAQIRRLRNILELTGRLQGDEVQESIDSLEVPSTNGSPRPVDVCLASNIIEVGVDIDRLSLICVVGQPKTTSQYIQVTGRIGRRRDRPGLVVAIYGASKPRDRSHFERFRSYHERLYAHVEPTSVTPFSPPALDRALHAVMAAYARQAGSAAVAQTPDPYPQALMDFLRDLLKQRAEIVDSPEVPNLIATFSQREAQWKRWQRIRWKGNPTLENTPLLREAGSYAPPYIASVSWPTPMSMRNVDAECQVEITQNYLNDSDGAQ